MMALKVVVRHGYLAKPDLLENLGAMVERYLKLKIWLVMRVSDWEL